MSYIPNDIRTWLRDHPVDDDADVAEAAARGHRSFLLWLIIRTVIAVIASGLLLTGLLQLRSLALESLVFSAAPKARLLVDPLTGKESLRITADASGSTPGRGSEIMTVRFDFGDGTIVGPQSDPIARHVYTDAGTYQIAATITDTNARSDQASATVTVEPRAPTLPRAALEVRPSRGPEPLAVVADAAGSSPGKGARLRSYRFDFGDNSPRKTQRDPKVHHVYDQAGSYRLTVRVRNSDGKTDESSRVITVTVPHRPLKAVLRVTPAKGVMPLVVEVDASASAPQTGATIRDYSFEYGDGTQNGPKPDPRDQHTYQAAGTYRVTVTVTDSLGGSGQARKTVKVAEPEPTVARLVVRPEKGIAPLGIKADASKSSPAIGASIESYQFNFGEGKPGDPQQKPAATHTYKETGKYTVTVTVTDSNDNSSSIERHVIVTGIPKPRIVEPKGDRAAPGNRCIFVVSLLTLRTGSSPVLPSEWFSSEDGFLGSGNDITVELSASPEPCKGRTHQISLVATDSDGNEVPDQKPFTVILVDPDC